MAQTATASTTTSPLVRVLQAFAGLAVLDVGLQFVSAGQLFGEDGPVLLHEAGAIALHVLSGVAAIAAVLLWRQGRVPAGLAALAGAVFVLGFVQAALGGYDNLYLHVPGAMLLTAGAVWLLVASLRLRP